MLDQQQFCLRWNNHGSTLVAVFENLLVSESLVDVTLFAEGRPFKAHKVVLSACSPYFQTVFAQTRDKHPIVILKDVKHTELAALLDYMYRGEVNVSQDQLGPLIKTAESLKIKGLADGTQKADSSDSKSSLAPANSTPKPENHLDGKRDFPAPPVSVPSVLSTVLTMPPALSLASSTFIPPIKLPNSSSDIPSAEESDSPHSKKRKRMRKKSGEGADSGDSDGRSAGSPGDSVHLPRIPATITPIAALTQQTERERDLDRDQEWPRDQEREKDKEQDRDQTEDRDRDRDSETDRDSRIELRASEASPDNVVGSSRGDSQLEYPRASPYSRPDSEPRSNSPARALSLLVRQDENSSDANHLSDEYEDRKFSSDLPRPSTSRNVADDAAHTPKFMWPYTPEQPSSEDPPAFPSFENTNQGIWKKTFLAPYLGSPLAPIPPRSHPGLGSPFPGLYSPHPTSPWGRHSPPTPTLSGPQLMRSNECSRCGRLYKTRKGLKHHIKNECGVEPRFQCTYCDWKFKQKAHLLRHVARKHTAS